LFISIARWPSAGLGVDLAHDLLAPLDHFLGGELIELFIGSEFFGSMMGMLGLVLLSWRNLLPVFNAGRHLGVQLDKFAAQRPIGEKAPRARQPRRTRCSHMFFLTISITAPEKSSGVYHQSYSPRIIEAWQPVSCWDQARFDGSCR
jgi:hypothetical protein